MFEKVEFFNENIIGIKRRPGPMSEDEVKFWVGTIKEELDEFETSIKDGDFPGQIDAVMDLLYFGAGALTRMGIPSAASEEIFQVIHSANMKKHRGRKVRMVQNDNDAVKPEGWEPPETKIMEILSNYFGT